METILVTSSQADERRQDHPWGTMWILAASQFGNSDKMTIGRVIIKSGERNPTHSHPTCQEVLYLTRGRLDYYVEGKKIELSAGDTLSIDAGKAHWGEAVEGEDAEMIVAFSSGVRDFKPEE